MPPNNLPLALSSFIGREDAIASVTRLLSHSRLVTLTGAEGLAQCDAVRLFCDRARAVQTAFQLTDQNAPAVAQICSRLDGMPLAIELAANPAQLPMFSNAEVPDASQRDGLNARELEVLRLLAAGLSNKAIAEQLVLSPFTVRAHLHTINGKLGIANRSAATRYALEHHLL